MKPKKPLPQELIEQPLVLYFDLLNPKAAVQVGRAQHGHILFTVRGDFRDDWFWSEFSGTQVRSPPYGVFRRRHFNLSPADSATLKCR